MGRWWRHEEDIAALSIAALIRTSHWFSYELKRHLVILTKSEWAWLVIVAKDESVSDEHCFLSNY